jgi:hypothetical protein
MSSVEVEFKAPPAIANEYINDFYRHLAPKNRGCVVSKIAQNHAKEVKYGPKGGDAELWPGTGYDVVLIKAHVDYYFAEDCKK